MASRYPPRVAASILLSGLTLGSLYFLVASGLSLIFGLMDVLNFAQGLLFMMGAYVGYTLYANPRMLWNTLPLALALVGGGIIGTALARSVAGPGALIARIERAIHGSVDRRDRILVCRLFGGFV
jgi:branched-chain amino acid transport system permease protein